MLELNVVCSVSVDMSWTACIICRKLWMKISGSNSIVHDDGWNVDLLLVDNSDAGNIYHYSSQLVV